MLLRGITQGHPFYDGNKRTGFLVAAYYLWKCGYDYPATMDADSIVDLCLAVSAGDVRDLSTIAAALRRFLGGWSVSITGPSLRRHSRPPPGRAAFGGRAAVPR